MDKNTEMIEVAVMVYPDGTVYWMDEPTDASVKAEIDLWKSHRPEYEGTRANMGCVFIRMPREKYQGIVTNHPRF